jgi:hypothetical protein
MSQKWSGTFSRIDTSRGSRFMMTEDEALAPGDAVDAVPNTVELAAVKSAAEPRPGAKPAELDGDVLR